jgi:hypothetical protein
MTNDDRDNHLIEILSSVGRIEENVGRHDRTLYGNGQPGLCTRLQIIETSAKTSMRWLAAIGVVIGAISGVAGAVVSQLLLTQ